MNLLMKKLSAGGLTAALVVSSVLGANVPAGYSVYSYEDLKIGNNAGMNGGVIGGKAKVVLGLDAKVTGSILANGSITLYDRSRVDGDVKSGSTVSLINGASIGGDKVQYTTVTQYTIPTKTITVGTTNKTVPDRGSLTVNPGNYNTITVGNDASITLKNGTYNVNTLTVRPGAKVKLDFPSTGSITINVKTSFLYSDRVAMEFVDCTDGSKVSVYYHGTTAISIGNEAVAYGAFSAPNAMLTVNDRAQCNGTIYAKKVELRPGLFSSGMIDQWLTIDSDGDGVPDYVENSCGTNPNSSSGDKPAKINTGTYANKTALGPQTVRMSVNHVAGYSHVADFPVTFAKNSIRGDLIPINNIIATNDYRAPSVTFPVPSGFRIDGNKYHAVTGEIVSGRKILFAFPISDIGTGITSDLIKLSHFNEQSRLWEDVEVAYVTGNAVYAFVSSFSVYSVSVSDAVYRVNDLAGLESTFLTINSDRVLNPNKKYYVYMNKGTFAATMGYTIPINTNLIGGFDFTAMSTNLNEPVASDPKKNRTIIDGSATTDPIIKMNDSELPNASIGSIVDGIEFLNSKSTSGPLVFSASLGHNTTIQVLNCVFEGSECVTSGGISLFNVSNVFIQSCVFVNNKISSIYSNPAGSAILISQYPQCGVEAKIHSCVFVNNQIGTSFSSASGTICNVGDFEDGTGPDGKPRTQRPVDIYNCTFYQNTTVNPSGGSVVYRSVREMPMSVRNCIIVDGTTTPIYGGTDAGTGTTLPADIVMTGTELNPSAYEFVNTTDLIGADNKWGTGDDGLRLKIGSDLCYKVQKSSYFSDRDVTGRWRKKGELGTARGDGSTTEWQDLGAYETYVNVLSVGSANTMGTANITNQPNDGWCYQSKLKTKAREVGYLLDFVGLTNSSITYGQNCYSGLGEDPSAPNTIIHEVGTSNSTISAYDIQMAAGPVDGTGGRITDYATYNSGTSSWTVNTDLVGLNFDFALMNIGDKEILAGTSPQSGSAYNDFKGFVTAFAAAAAGKKVLLSTPVLDGLAEDGGVLADAIVNPIRNASTGAFGNAIFSNGSISGNMNANSSMLNQVEDRNYISTDVGFEIMATVWWNLMNSFLSTF